jgi:hypothetical protein
MKIFKTTKSVFRMPSYKKNASSQATSQPVVLLFSPFSLLRRVQKSRKIFSELSGCKETINMFKILSRGKINAQQAINAHLRLLQGQCCYFLVNFLT